MTRGPRSAQGTLIQQWSNRHIQPSRLRVIYQDGDLGRAGGSVHCIHRTRGWPSHEERERNRHRISVQALDICHISRCCCSDILARICIGIDIDASLERWAAGPGPKAGCWLPTTRLRFAVAASYVLPPCILRSARRVLLRPDKPSSMPPRLAITRREYSSIPVLFINLAEIS